MSSVDVGSALASTIRYKDLDSSLKEIRLLEIGPGVGEDVLVCKLKHVSLLEDPAPIYETISYCWGAPRDPIFVKLDGYLVLVTPSSEAAVRRMRLQDQSRVLWIDAICIDQTSVSERSEQVALMSSIYSLAKGNLIYLGEDEIGLAERAMHSVQKLLSEMRVATYDFTSLYPVVSDKTTGLRLYSDQGFQSEIDFEALQGLFELPWFQRLWVQQEVALASRNTCHWGQLEFDLSDVTRVTEWLEHKSGSVPPSLTSSRGRACANMMFSNTDVLVKSAYTPKNLAILMAILQSTVKTEPRDGVYALLGLLPNGVAVGDGWDRLLEVDYSKPVSHVARDATRYALADRKEFTAMHLGFFSAEQRDAVEGFPSWAVRVDLSIDLGAAPRAFPQVSRASRGLQAPSLFLDISHGPAILLGQGFVTDYVTEVAPTYFGDRTAEGLCLWLTKVKDMALRYCSKLFERDSSRVYSDIASTLTAERSRTGRAKQREDSLVLTECLDSLDYQEEPPSPAVTANIWEEFSKTMYIYYRRFFVTKKGRMGIGPQAMRPGDAVAILRGGRLPLILREVDGEYTHIGSAYVRGIMFGEAVQEWQARDEPEMVFPIR